MKTQEQIEALKANWLKDPIWDIEETEGFEDHREELLAFRQSQERAWTEKETQRMLDRRNKVAAWTGIEDLDLAQYISTFDEIEGELKALNSQIGDGGSALGWCSFVIAREQVRASLLLAAQVKRVADALEERLEIGELEEHRSELLESTRIYGSDKQKTGGDK